VGYFYYSENLNWAAKKLCMRPEGRGLDIAVLNPVGQLLLPDSRKYASASLGSCKKMLHKIFFVI